MFIIDAFLPLTPATVLSVRGQQQSGRPWGPTPPRS
jgi:hypothetical protein